MMDLQTNVSSVTEFVFVGYQDLQGLTILFFFFLSFAYILALLGNMSIIGIITLDPSLHGPMYFLLGHLSTLDICYISVTVPKMMHCLISGKYTISFTGCMVQLNIFLSLEGAEAFLLAAMAFDRFIAICYPLSYSLLMSRKVCVLLTSASWLGGCLNSLVHSILIVKLIFCGPNGLQNFFCDIPPLLQLSCSDTQLNELLIFTLGGIFVCIIPFLSILVSYIYIAIAVLKMRSATGKQKAFSTCASHLTVVTMFYGAAFFMYDRPSSTYAFERERVVSVLYSIVPPMLNPLIYSLRSKEVKRAFKRMRMQLYTFVSAKKAGEISL